MDSKSYWMVCLAGLLHDIGMFIGGNDAPREFIAACRPAFSAHVNTELLYAHVVAAKRILHPGRARPVAYWRKRPLPYHRNGRRVLVARSQRKRQESRTRQLQSIFSRIEWTEWR